MSRFVLVFLFLARMSRIASSFSVTPRSRASNTCRGASTRQSQFSLCSSLDDAGGEGGMARKSSRIEGNQRPATEQELQIMDEMIDKLASAKPYELPNAVQRAFRVISSPQFFLRIAARQDEATGEEKERLAALASNLVSTLEAVVSTTEDRLDERAQEVQTVVAAAAEPESGEFMVPLLPERVEAMRNELLKLDPSSLDEGFLSTLDAWMNKSHEDGMDLMVGILQKAMQMYAGIAITRAREREQSADEDPEAIAVFDELLKTDAENWQSVLNRSDVPLPKVQSTVQKAMEGIVLSLDAGSMAQRVQAEYLQEMVKRIETTQQA